MERLTCFAVVQNVAIRLATKRSNYKGSERDSHYISPAQIRLESV